MTVADIKKYWHLNVIKVEPLLMPRMASYGDYVYAR